MSAPVLDTVTFFTSRRTIRACSLPQLADGVPSLGLGEAGIADPRRRPGAHSDF
jgi:hypothetical protein